MKKLRWLAESRGGFGPSESDPERIGNSLCITPPTLTRVECMAFGETNIVGLGVTSICTFLPNLTRNSPSSRLIRSFVSLFLKFETWLSQSVSLESDLCPPKPFCHLGLQVMPASYPLFLQFLSLKSTNASPLVKIPFRHYTDPILCAISTSQIWP